MWNDPEQRARSIAGVVIIFLGALLLVDQLSAGSMSAWVWILAFAAAAVGFGWTYLNTREAWTAIVAYVMGAIGALIFTVTQLDLSGALLPALVLGSIGAPFVVAWLLNRKEWGYLVPAYVLFAIAFGLLITEPGGDDWLPAYVLGAIGLPFMVAALLQRNWALLLPGGIMWVIAFSLLPRQSGDLARIIGIAIPLALIGAGALLLLRKGDGDDAPARRKHEDF
ncbi:MAG: hypothetical protein JW910_00430 [Anaerolineae bacterium]|nr:hypothetical protein [Anaerolineae bacterium]